MEKLNFKIDISEGIIKQFIINPFDKGLIDKVMKSFNYIDPIDYMILGKTLKVYTNKILNDKKLMKHLNEFISN